MVVGSVQRLAGKSGERLLLWRCLCVPWRHRSSPCIGMCRVRRSRRSWPPGRRRSSLSRSSSRRLGFDHCNPPERLLASAFRSPSLALGLAEPEGNDRHGCSGPPAGIGLSESARAGSEKSLQIIFPMELSPLLLRCASVVGRRRRGAI
jgi:hypothetical protein